MTAKKPAARATTASRKSQVPSAEADRRVPESTHENVEKLVNEAAAGDGVVDAVRRAGRELDRTFGGEYEARQDRAARPKARRSSGR